MNIAFCVTQKTKGSGFLLGTSRDGLLLAIGVWLVTREEPRLGQRSGDASMSRDFERLEALRRITVKRLASVTHILHKHQLAGLGEPERVFYPLGPTVALWPWLASATTSTA